MDIVGLNINNIKMISKIKKEEKWLTNYRLSSYNHFNKIALPNYISKMDIDFQKIIYYRGKDNNSQNNWDNIDQDVKREIEDLGVLDSQSNFGGLGIQYESEVIYNNMIKELKTRQVIFTSIETAIKKYPELVKKHFGKIVSNNDNKFAALNSAVFSGGIFIYIPPNTKLERPLQSYFRINSKNMGQFERTLIIVDDNSELHYLEGCTAPINSEDSLHAAVVEIYVGKNSKCRYSTIQNWSSNVYNLVTKRALVMENGTMEWIDGNIGSKITMKYPACILQGNNANGMCITVSVASHNQNQDTGARMIHIGKQTKSKIIAKSISKNGGKTTYRGKVDIKASALNSESLVKCDTLILDGFSVSDTIPINIIRNKTSFINHEAKISKIDEEKLFYLMSRGLNKEEASELIVLGFLEEFKEELPIEYAVELNQLLKKSL
ncbi:MAG: Fe-S cluster assembly protein SufB [Tenericutes bacterium]|nr:Fe-S cluster assembly protein SufB [Mycoplasmatota bacterium]